MKMISINIITIAALLLLMTGEGRIFAQKGQLEVTYTAIDSASWLQLDSIKVINRSRGGDTVLYWPDTVLVLDYSVGISSYDEIENAFELYQNYPNPIIDKTNIKLNIPEKGEVHLVIGDISGNKLAERSEYLQAGFHSFCYTPSVAGFQILRVQYKGQLKSMKMIIEGNAAMHQASLSYHGIESGQTITKHLDIINGFSFNLDDTLLYVCYADSLESGMLDAPITDNTYTLQFATNIACPGIPTVDYGGQVYNTIQIFSQCWLKENLNIGEMIPGQQEMTDNDIIEKYCYNNDPAKREVYGGLYQWNEMMDYRTIQGGRGICPQGWHSPTDEEWKVLEGAVDSYYDIGDSEWDDAWEWRGANAGKHLRSINGWPDASRTDSYGFKALPGGNRGYDGTFYVGGYGGSLWTSTESTYNQNWAWTRSISYLVDQIYRHENVPKAFGFAFRCLED